MESGDSSLREPTRSNRIRWLVEYVRGKAPVPLSTITVAEVEKVTGLAWGTDDLRVGVLIEAKKALYRGLPPYEWRVTAEGLFFLDDPARVIELRRREREALARYREVLASSQTINRNALTTEQAAELDRSTAASLRAYNEAKLSLRRLALTAGGTLGMDDS